MPIGSCETTSALHCVTHCVCVDLCLVRHSLCVDVLGKRRWRRVTDVLGPGLPAHCVDALQ